jgi:protein TonB
VSALLFHAAIAAVAGVSHASSEHEQPAPRQELVAVLEKQPPPPAPPPPAPPRKPPPSARSPKLARPVPRQAVPPAPAQAGKVVAAAPDPNAAVDMTDFNLVVGEGKSYAGGYSAAKGRSTQAVESPRAVIGGKPDTPPSPARDLSRPASPAHRYWSCPWPEEEQTTDLREVRVTIRAAIDADGAPGKIDILNAPPGGFAAAARRCAEGEKFQAARDPQGRSIASSTAPFVVQFIR